MKLTLTRPLVFFDLETTGVDPYNDRIVQLAAIKYFPDGQKTTHEWIVNPGMPIPKGASDIHGITDDMVQDKPLLGDLTKDLATLFDGVDLGGYNVKNFDLAVLQAYYPGRVEVFPTFDILEDIKEKIGKRISLNEVVIATLAKKKTGHGLQAINLFKEGRIDELKKYCLDDVMLTKELFEYGIKNQEIFYLNEKGKVTIKVDWKKYLEEEKKTSDTPLTLPF